ncbi:hypothetical protein [Kordia sp.]|uniref:hypothetical protein n=1 Tax=Kordia sp. TaxID=1965332 RepID=UPI003D6C2A57
MKIVFTKEKIRNSIVCICLLVSLTLTGQVQKKIFVNDIQGVEYVTVNFCVDNEAKISKVTIDKDKTTYKNEENIKLLREYLLGIQFYSDSKLKNNCYDSTFTYINYKYEDKSLSKEECYACEKFKTGLFGYEHVLYQGVKIKRKRKVQKEIGADDKQIYSIKWLSNCTYVLTYKRMTEPRLKHLIGKEIHVEIIDVLKNGSYVYRSTTKFDDIVDYGIIKKIK